MKRILISAACLALVCQGARAASIGDCGDLNDITLIPEPIADHSRSFLSGNVRVTTVDTGGEPVCCSAHALIEVVNEDGWKACFRLSMTDDQGYAWVYADRAVLLEQDEKKVYLFVPVEHYAHAGGTADFDVEMIELEIGLQPPAVQVE